MTEDEHREPPARQSDVVERIGQEAGALAHDLNNVVAVILNYATLLDEQIVELTPIDDERWDTARTDVARILVAAQRAARLAHDLLALAGRAAASDELINVNDVIRSLEPLLRATIGIGEQVELVTKLAPDLWPIIVGPGLMEQVLVNLAVNARDGMPDGGTLTFETENVVVDDAIRVTQPEVSVGRYVRLRARDTGVGMAEEVRAHAFEPFFTTKPEGEGTGLGLATVYRVVTQAGGYAHVHSQLGAGTTFTALLPAARANPPRNR